MAVGSRIREFDLSETSSWVEYVERIQLYCAANKLTTEEDKRAVLLSCCGPETYSLITTLVKPSRPPNVDYQIIVDAVKKHVNPKPSELYAMYVFSKRDQQEGEGVADFVTALGKLSENCGFGGTKFPLEEMLRDRLVFGISDNVVQERLLAEKNLTFDTAYELAITAEAAAKQQKAIRSNAQELEFQQELTSKVELEANKRQPERQRSCFRCLGAHAGWRCRYKDSVCFNCGGKGHLAKACRRKPAEVEAQLEDRKNSAKSEYDELFSISQVKNGTPKYVITVEIGNEIVPMEVDSGAARSIISVNEFRKLQVAKRMKVDKCDTQLVTWTKEGLDVLGKVSVPVKFKDRELQLPLLVLKNDGNTLLGRNWFQPLGISLTGLHSINVGPQAIVEKFADVFSETFPGANLPRIHIELKEAAQARFLKCRSIPFAMKNEVVAELNRLEELGILKPTQYSDWATPIIVVRKKDGSLRICGDYRSTVNQAVKSNVYPLPTSKELFARLGRGRVFSKLDLTQAYQQLLVDEETAELLTINTVQGLYKVCRLPFGVSIAPGVFQRTMDMVLAGMPQVAVYLDDILIASESIEEHQRMLAEVLSRLSKTGLRVQAGKCEFFKESLEFLGHRIDAKGIYPSKAKVEAIHQAPAPKNKKELQTFLAYEYVLDYRKTKDHGNADCLSRLPAPLTREETEVPGDILLLEAVEYPPHSTPHSETGKSPAEVMLGRNFRTALSILQRDESDARCPLPPPQRGFLPGDAVYARNFRPGPEWYPGRVLRRLGHVMYELRTVLCTDATGTTCAEHGTVSPET
ncbi:uncharacterized protein K02A2.6-like [Rhipicephalus sanguineus]|uniref:uncharacterized protein K02A2.6-like n=1 Tax=Rhipicephalus sanguineus TaxID=34632 RepID=UPI001895B8F7|nr:uncharacterized protein K02A2.6-like [Rhipicephalus sanguineus]